MAEAILNQNLAALEEFAFKGTINGDIPENGVLPSFRAKEVIAVATTGRHEHALRRLAKEPQAKELGILAAKYKGKVYKGEIDDQNLSWYPEQYDAFILVSKGNGEIVVHQGKSGTIPLPSNSRRGELTMNALIALAKQANPAIRISRHSENDKPIVNPNSHVTLDSLARRRYRMLHP